MSLFPERPRQSLFSSQSASTGKMHSDIHHRVGTSSFRSKPYNKPTHLGPAPSRPPTLDPDSRWCHDLFEDDSNLYGPKVRFQAKPPEVISFGLPARPSPSLRPFGSSTSISPNIPLKPLSSTTSTSSINPTSSIQPLTSSTVSIAPTNSQRYSTPTNQSQSNRGLSLLSRIQANNNHASPKPLLFNNYHHNSQPNENQTSRVHSHQNLTPSFDQQFTLTSQPQQQQIKIQNQNSKSQQAFEAAMAKYLNSPVILEVANLADGTSAEDVKTAFADFGEIQECITEEGARQANQPTLKAKMVFTHKAEAEKAVEALNGALADGLTLAVRIIGRTIKKPERVDFMSTDGNHNSNNGISTAKPQETNTIRSATNKSILHHESKSADQDVLMDDGDQSTSPPIVPTGRLRSEVVAQCDPRASIQVEPKPIPIYQREQPLPPKPITQNMLSRVQPLVSNEPSFQSYSNHQQQGTFKQNQNYNGGFGNHHHSNSTHSSFFQSNPRQHHESQKSLLARIKPN